MKKTLSFIILCVLAGLMAGCTQTQNPGNSQEPATEQGQYYDLNDLNGNPVGSCIRETTHPPDGFGIITKETFFDSQGNRIGSCSAYNGPGSSGCGKGGCDSNLLTNEPTNEGMCGTIRSPKFYCRTSQ